MDIATKINGGSGVLELRGRFDFSAHRAFRESYDALLTNPVVTDLNINLAGVEYMDSSALGMLLMLRERTTGAGKKLVLSRPNSTVTQILDIANFPKLFTIL